VKAGAEIRIFIRAQNAEIAQSEALQIVLRLSEIEIKQKLNRLSAPESNELPAAAIRVGGSE